MFRLCYWLPKIRNFLNTEFKKSCCIFATIFAFLKTILVNPIVFSDRLAKNFLFLASNSKILKSNWCLADLDIEIWTRNKTILPIWLIFQYFASSYIPCSSSVSSCLQFLCGIKCSNSFPLCTHVYITV